MLFTKLGITILRMVFGIVQIILQIGAAYQPGETAVHLAAKAPALLKLGM